jgi:hypothetical protein
MDYKKPDQYKNINSSEHKKLSYKNDVRNGSFISSTKTK